MTPTKVILIFFLQIVLAFDVSAQMNVFRSNNYTKIDNSYVAPMVSSNLQLNLDASNSASYSGTGGTWYDLTSNSLNGTIHGATYNSGNGGYFDFNGTSNYIDIGQPLSNGASYTINAWVYLMGTGANQNIVSSSSSPFFIYTGSLYAGVGANYLAVNGGVFPLNQWKYVTTTFDDAANTMKIYINGALITTSTTVTQSFTQESFRIGAHFLSDGSPVSFWQGRIASVSIYNGPLTSAQVLTNFNATKTRFGL